MKPEKIDFDLLKKYTENTCTKEERALIEDWLKSDVFDNIPSNLEFEANKDKLKQEIWESLPSGSHSQKKKKLLLVCISKCTACAAILAVVIVGFLQKEMLTNTFSTDRQLTSQIVQVCDQPTYIIPEHDSEIVFVSSTSTQKDLCQKVNCAKGNTYLAIMVKYKSTHEILVIDKRDIENLPPQLEMQIATQIKS